MIPTTTEWMLTVTCPQVPGLLEAIETGLILRFLSWLEALTKIHNEAPYSTHSHRISADTTKINHNNNNMHRSTSLSNIGAHVTLIYPLNRLFFSDYTMKT